MRRKRMKRIFAISSFAALSMPAIAKADPIPSGGLEINNQPVIEQPVSDSESDISEKLITDGEEVVTVKRYRSRNRGKLSYKARIPQHIPERVKKLLQAGNSISGLPYRYGGGHSGFNASAFDCSGAVSSILGKAGLLKRPLDSNGLAKYGKPGKGKWVTLYSNPEHAFIVVAGLRFDTSRTDDPSKAPALQWRPLRKDTKKFVATHPEGY